MTVELKVVELVLQERIATISFNRPDALNALNEEVLEQFIQCLKVVEESEADFLIVKGNGKVFSAGGDINMMMSPSQSERFEQVMDLINEAVLTLYSLPQMTISVLHGAAAGLGLSIALALIPDGGGHFLLEKRIGAHRAKQLIWEGKTLKAEEAHQFGIIDEIKEGDLAKHVEDYLSYWLKKPSRALKETKRIYVETSVSQLKQVLALEKRSQFAMSQSSDHKEGVRAFLEKRAPVFNQSEKDISEN